MARDRVAEGFFLDRARFKANLAIRRSDPQDLAVGSLDAMSDNANKHDLFENRAHSQPFG